MLRVDVSGQGLTVMMFGGTFGAFVWGLLLSGCDKVRACISMVPSNVNAKAIHVRTSVIATGAGAKLEFCKDRLICTC
jgi:hypothetical protein